MNNLVQRHPDSFLSESRTTPISAQDFSNQQNNKYPKMVYVDKIL